MFESKLVFSAVVILFLLGIGMVAFALFSAGQTQQTIAAADSDAQNAEPKAEITLEAQVVQDEGTANAQTVSKSETAKNTTTSVKQDTQTNASTENYTNATAPTDCLGRYNLTAQTVVFYYSRSDESSENMQLIVSELSDMFPFYKTNQRLDKELNTCFNLEADHIPAFVCAGSKQMIVGEVSQFVLQQFAETCN